MKSTPYIFLVCLVLCLSDQSLPAQTVTPPSSEVDVTGAAMTLMEIVRETKDPDAKWRAISAVRDLRYKNAAPLLLECLKDHNNSVRAYAARALGDIGIDTASAPLIDLLKQERDGGVIEQTSLALTLLQAHEAVPILKQCANHESLQTRSWVLQAIGNLGSRADVHFLAKHLDASDMLERASAAQGIETLANVDFEFPKARGGVYSRHGIYNPEAAIKRAKDWWEKNKSAFSK